MKLSLLVFATIASLGQAQTSFSVSDSYQADLAPFGAPQTLTFTHDALSAFAPGSYTINHVTIEAYLELNSTLDWQIIAGKASSLNMGAGGTLSGNNATWSDTFSIELSLQDNFNRPGPFQRGQNGSELIYGDFTHTSSVSNPNFFVASAQSLDLTGSHSFSFSGHSTNPDFQTTFQGLAGLQTTLKITYEGTKNAGAVPEPTGAITILLAGGLALIRRNRR